MPSPPVRATTLKNFIKDRTGLRVGDGPVARLTDLITAVLEHIADTAKELVVDDDRSTLMERDVDVAYQSFLESRGPTLLSPTTIHTAIDGIANEDLTQLINLLRADLEEQP